MSKPSNSIFKFFIALSIQVIFIHSLNAHSMPNSNVNITIADRDIFIRLEIPIQELEVALKKDLLNNESKILGVYKTEIGNYLLKHVQIKSIQGEIQPVELNNLTLSETSYDFGKYLELRAEITSKASPNFNNRDFIIFYDAVIHQLVTHFAVLKIKSDFDNGITPEDTSILSVVQVDVASGKIFPVHIQIDKGSKWKGFKKMIKLGMHHIKTGLDHLLFILILIIISPLTLIHKKWGGFSGWQNTLFRLFKIITAFTIGHSLTLGIFSLMDLNNFSYIIEATIALTIMITAYHAIRPIFPSKELYITFMFGLIHGSAFGMTINEWGVTTSQKLLCLLGFNIGIELMQILIVIACIPLIYLSKFDFYSKVRSTFAILTILLSFFWLIERLTGKPNKITTMVEKILQ